MRIKKVYITELAAIIIHPPTECGLGSRTIPGDSLPLSLMSYWVLTPRTLHFEAVMLGEEEHLKAVHPSGEEQVLLWLLEPPGMLPAGSPASLQVLELQCPLSRVYFV